MRAHAAKLEEGEHCVSLLMVLMWFRSSNFMTSISIFMKLEFIKKI